jgi:hypothetical protein
MSTNNRFELWVIDERGTLSKPSDEGDHSEFQLPHSIKGWALIGRTEIVLFRADKSEPAPRQIRLHYTRRFPKRHVTDRYEYTHTEVFIS